MSAILTMKPGDIVYREILSLGDTMGDDPSTVDTASVVIESGGVLYLVWLRGEVPQGQEEKNAAVFCVPICTPGNPAATRAFATQAEALLDAAEQSERDAKETLSLVREVRDFVAAQ
jgi:hypothetical protein